MDLQGYSTTVSQAYLEHLSFSSARKILLDVQFAHIVFVLRRPLLSHGTYTSLH